MIDADVVAVSALATYRVLPAAGVLDHFSGETCRKGNGFVEASLSVAPTKPPR